jgi:hypothetical protein
MGETVLNDFDSETVDKRDEFEYTISQKYGLAIRKNPLCFTETNWEVVKELHCSYRAKKLGRSFKTAMLGKATAFYRRSSVRSYRQTLLEEVAG